MPLLASGSNSSDYFEEDNPDFLSALGHAVLPGDSPADDSDETQELQPPPSTQPSLKRRWDAANDEDRTHKPQSTMHHTVESPQTSDTYGASHFGDFGEYMRRKRAKLQIQNVQLEDQADAANGGIFKGLAIYVGAWMLPRICLYPESIHRR